MPCPQCQQENPSAAKFCLHCGTRLALVCPNCQQILPPAARFCMACGQALTASPPPAIQDAPAELYAYSGYLTFTSLPDEKLQQVRCLTDQSGLEVDVGETWLEFEYSGRDTNIKVRHVLKNLAYIIGQAEGEIACEIASEDGDPTFEFYTVNNQGLYVQKGAIVREKTKHKLVQKG